MADGGGGAVGSAVTRELVTSLLPRIEELERRQAQLERERDEYRKLYLLAREEIEQLKRGLLGQKAHRAPQDDSQLALFLLELALGAEGGSDAHGRQRVPEHERRQPVRKPLPEHLPRVRVELVPPEVEREGLDAFEQIGSETREVIERRPASVVVVEVVKKKFVRKAERQAPRTEVLVAETPELPVPRGRARSVGWVDSMRTGPDIAYVMVPAPLYGFYAGQSRHTALRSFTDAWWSLDPDVVLLRGDRMQDVDAWSTVVADALAGGNYLLGDGRQAGELRARLALDPEVLAMHDGRAARPLDMMKEYDPSLIPSPLFDLKGETTVPHVWEKRSADGGRHWLAVFAWRASPYQTEVDLPRGTVEIVPPTSEAAETTTQPIEGHHSIEVPLHAVRLFRW